MDNQQRITANDADRLAAEADHVEGRKPDMKAPRPSRNTDEAKGKHPPYDRVTRELPRDELQTRNS